MKDQINTDHLDTSDMQLMDEYRSALFVLGTSPNIGPKPALEKLAQMPTRFCERDARQPRPQGGFYRERRLEIHGLRRYRARVKIANKMARAD